MHRSSSFRLTLVASAAVLAPAVFAGVQEFTDLLKHASDSDAQSIKETHTTTIAELNQMERPAEIRANGKREADRRFGKVEQTIWCVRARVEDAEIREDGDLRLVISDGSGHEIVAECPGWEALDAGVFRAKVAQSRQDAARLLSPSEKVTHPGTWVEIHAVGYFGRLPKNASETHVNGFRLMPILSIKEAK